ncbi:DUF4105 domain-containing protein [uncultured Flavobacterium sp.]|uniref:lipoprotein N-acyltransferase Lnb domain-containing protein n=1 Tax=uncultured Flavobacterium sp. TaxID=165435 RepID=UPI0030CA370F
MFKKILFLLLIFAFTNGFSQKMQLSKNAKVSIITIGTASPTYALYGHTAIRFKDEQSLLDVVFNYGSFDFETKNFMLRFVKGDLQYFASSSPYAPFEYAYRYENRSVYEQVLDLPLDKIQSLYTSITNSLTSNERFYTYKFIDKNCTTMIIDKINEVLGSTVIRFEKSQKLTYRSVLFPYTNQHFFQQLGINIIFGRKVDEKASTLFLPLDLMQELKNISYKGKKLVRESTTVYEAPKQTNSFNFFDSIYILIMFLSIVVFLNNKTITLAYFSVLGLLGIFFSLVGLYSWHEEVLWNYNILLFNPFYLVLLFFYKKQNLLKFKKIKWFLFYIILVYVFLMLKKAHLFLILPLVITNVILLYRLTLTFVKNDVLI